MAPFAPSHALFVSPASTESEETGASGKAIIADSCRRKDDVGATLVVALLPATGEGPAITLLINPTEATRCANGATTRVAPTADRLRRGREMTQFWATTRQPSNPRRQTRGVESSNGRSIIEIDMLVEHQCAVLVPDDVVAVEPVPVLVEIVGALGACVALHGENRLAQLRGFQAFRIADRAGKNMHGIVDPRRVKVGGGFVGRLVFGGECLGRRTRIPV